MLTSRRCLWIILIIILPFSLISGLVLAEKPASVGDLKEARQLSGSRPVVAPDDGNRSGDGAGPSDLSQRSDTRPKKASETTSAGPAKTIPPDVVEELVGEIATMRKVALGTKVAGRLAKVPLFAGDSAKAGAEIASLETRDFELAVAQAQASLDVTKARLKLMVAGSRPEEKKQADEQMRQAKANMENTQADMLRTRDLFSTGAVSKSALDAAEAKATVSEAQYMGVKQQKAIVDQGPRIEDIEATRAQLRQQDALVEIAKLQLEYATLKAPFDGMVAQRLVDEGGYVTTTLPIYSFMQRNPIFAVIDCPERIVPKLKPGTKAKITLDALPNQKFTGILERVPAFIDSKTRSARAEFVIQNPDGFLTPGMFARAQIQFSEAEATERKW